MFYQPRNPKWEAKIYQICELFVAMGEHVQLSISNKEELLQPYILNFGFDVPLRQKQQFACWSAFQKRKQQIAYLIYEPLQSNANLVHLVQKYIACPLENEW